MVAFGLDLDAARALFVNLAQGGPISDELAA
jgi:hypothetical protein